jgi:hypothetical protein
MEEINNEELVKLNTKELLSYIDLRKLIEYGKILIEHDLDSENVSITSENNIKETIVIHRQDNNESMEKIIMLKDIIYTIGNAMDLIPNKHSEYMLNISASPNSDNLVKEIGDIIGEENTQKLYDAGYDITKDI